MQYRVHTEYSDDMVHGRHVVVVREWAEHDGYFPGTRTQHYMVWVPALHTFRGSGWTRDEALQEAWRNMVATSSSS